MDKIPFEWHEPLHTAAVCVYPARVQDAVNALRSINKLEDIKVASGKKKRTLFFTLDAMI